MCFVASVLVERNTQDVCSLKSVGLCYCDNENTNVLSVS